MSATKFVYFCDAGVAETGLTLTWEYLKKANGDDVSPAPSFTEVGGGWYKYTADVPSGDVAWAGVVDGSATLAADEDRYKPVLHEYESIEAKVDVIDGIVDDILVDTGTTLPASLAALVKEVIVT